MPEPQGVHDAVRVAAAYKPAAHGAHCNDVALPVPGAAVPTGQAVQLVVPVPDWKLPALHWVHDMALACDAKLPAEQLVHTKAPMAAYWPATHDGATPQLDEPAAAVLPAAHAVHLDDAVAPVVVPYRPAAQLVQLMALGADW